MLVLRPNNRLGVPAGLAGLVLMLVGCGEPMQEEVPKEEVPKDPPCEKGESCQDKAYYERCPVECTFCGNGRPEYKEGCDNKYNDGVFDAEDDQYFSGDVTEVPCKSDCSKLADYCGDAMCQEKHEDAGSCELDCPARCGDGVLSEGEKCDDGNADNYDSCLVDCMPALCGDGIVQLGVEECDDANMNDDKGACTQACKNAICGDGIVMVGWEECDDANDVEIDECNKYCELIVRRTVFVSSSQFFGDLGGLDGADAKCQALAKAKDPKLPGNFKAWLSDATTGPASRFDTAFTGVYELVDGTIVAHGWADLTDGSLVNLIGLDEMNMAEGEGTVWSNTSASGESLKGDACASWTSGKATDKGGLGLTGATDSTWTESGSTTFCSLAANLYCFQDP